MDDNTENGKPIILFIGDWFIDENWLMAKDHTYNSSHTGDIHYINKSTDLSQHITSLCGVPEILAVLKPKMEGTHNLIACGVWNKDDEAFLKCVLCDKNKNGNITPLKITNFKYQNPNLNKCPYSGNNGCNEENNECKYDPELICLGNDSIDYSTNRIIRVFEGHSGGEPHIIYRFDWELPVEEDKLDFSHLEKAINDRTIAAVIIEDHNKGVINKNTIAYLMQKAPVAKWYIRSKSANPIWLKELESNTKIRLKVVDHMTVQNQVHRLWSYGSELGRASLELLGDLTCDDKYEHGEKMLVGKHTTERVAILFDDNKVIAKDDKKCYNLNSPPGKRQFINIGRTTIFFSSLIWQDLVSEFSQNDFGKQCNIAQILAYKWSRNASDAWKKNNIQWRDYEGALKIENGEQIQAETVSQIYTTVWDEWNKSSKDLGILDNGNSFQLWRGEGAIKGHICVGGHKRERINDLVSSIAQFRNQKKPKSPFNCLLVSKPGWGKSSLAKSIADHFGMLYMEFSLSQMATTSDLIDCFDSICSKQNRTQEQLLILMDEVNCKIQGNLALGLLLSPIMDQSFISNGKYYKLLPAVWIFASTDPIDKLQAENKGEDFTSRLNGPIIHLDMDNDKASDLGIEQVYLGIYLLNKYWGPISEVEEGIFHLFHDMKLNNGIRSLGFFVDKFKNIKRGKVLINNVPEYSDYPGLNRHISLPVGWGIYPSYLKTNLINIETIIKR